MMSVIILIKIIYIYILYNNNIYTYIHLHINRSIYLSILKDIEYKPIKIIM